MVKKRGAWTGSPGPTPLLAFVSSLWPVPSWDPGCCAPLWGGEVFGPFCCFLGVGSVDGWVSFPSRVGLGVWVFWGLKAEASGQPGAGQAGRGAGCLVTSNLLFTAAPGPRGACVQCLFLASLFSGPWLLRSSAMATPVPTLEEPLQAALRGGAGYLRGPCGACSGLTG